MSLTVRRERETQQQQQQRKLDQWQPYNSGSNTDGNTLFTHKVITYKQNVSGCAFCAKNSIKIIDIQCGTFTIELNTNIGFEISKNNIKNDERKPGENYRIHFQ